MPKARKYFGTDGVRGRVGEPPITPDFVMRLGYAAGKVLAAERELPSGEHAAVLIGKDTRISGYMLESALGSRVLGGGSRHLAVPARCRRRESPTSRARCACRPAWSSRASHNPFEDNGIKFFSADGIKLPDEVEQEIEARLERRCRPCRRRSSARPAHGRRGRPLHRILQEHLPEPPRLRGVKLVVDCAHGATYHVAPHVFHELGAEVIAIGNQPGRPQHQRECGATHPRRWQRLSRRTGPTSASRSTATATGWSWRIPTGSCTTATSCSTSSQAPPEAGTLKGGVAGTLMTNLGMEQALARARVPFARAAVGDRYVLELLNERGWQFGGENSGHIVCLDKHSTGDGIISACRCCTRCAPGPSRSPSCAVT